MNDLNDNQNILSSLKEHYILILSFSALLCSAIGFWNEYRLLSEFGLNIVIFAEIDDFFLAGLKNPLTYFSGFFICVAGTAYSFLVIHRFDNSSKSFEENDDGLEKKYKDSKKKYQQISKFNNYPLNSIFFLLEAYYQIDKEKLDQEYSKLIEQQNHRKALVKSRRNELIRVLLSLAIGMTLVFVLLESVINSLDDIARIRDKPSRMATVQLRNKIVIPDNLSQPLVFITATDKFMFFYQHDTEDELSTIAIPIASILSVRYSDFKKKTLGNNLP